MCYCTIMCYQNWTLILYLFVHVLTLIIIIIIIHVLFYCVWDFLVGGVYHLCILCVHIDWLYTP